MPACWLLSLALDEPLDLDNGLVFDSEEERADYLAQHDLVAAAARGDLTLLLWNGMPERRDVFLPLLNEAQRAAPAPPPDDPSPLPPEAL